MKSILVPNITPENSRGSNDSTVGLSQCYQESIRAVVVRRGPERETPSKILSPTCPLPVANTAICGGGGSIANTAICGGGGGLNRSICDWAPPAYRSICDWAPPPHIAVFATGSGQVGDKILLGVSLSGPRRTTSALILSWCYGRHARCAGFETCPRCNTQDTAWKSEGKQFSWAQST